MLASGFGLGMGSGARGEEFGLELIVLCVVRGIAASFKGECAWTRSAIEFQRMLVKLRRRRVSRVDILIGGRSCAEAWEVKEGGVAQSEVW